MKQTATLGYEVNRHFFAGAREKTGVTIKNRVRGYRFGFNSQEKDDEVKGNGNSYDFGARIHDPRLGRFLSIDPKVNEYPWNSPYSFADNSPIRYIDAYGKNPVLPVYFLYEGAVIAIEIISSYIVAKQIADNMPSTVFANRNPGYDWQRKQEREAKAFNTARDIVFKNMIDKHTNQDPNEFKDPKGRWGKFGLAVGGLYLLDQIQSELNRMKIETGAKLEDTNNQIQQLKAKDELSSGDKKELNNLQQKSYGLNLDLRGIQDALNKTNDLIQKEKEDQTMNKSQAAPSDATTTVPPPSTLEIKK